MVRLKFSLGPDILSWKTLLMHKSQWKDDTPNLSSENLNLWNWIWKSEIKNLDKNMKTKLVKQKLERDFWEANPGQNFESSCVTKVGKKPLPVIFFEASQSEAEQKNSGNDVFSLLRFFKNAAVSCPAFDNSLCQTLSWFSVGWFYGKIWRRKKRMMMTLILLFMVIILLDQQCAEFNERFKKTVDGLNDYVPHGHHGQTLDQHM